MAYIFSVASYDELLAKIYLRKHGLDDSKEAIANRSLERNEIWSTLFRKERGEKGALAQKRCEVFEVTLADVENVFDSGEEVGVFQINLAYLKYD